MLIFVQLQVKYKNKNIRYAKFRVLKCHNITFVNASTNTQLARSLNYRQTIFSLASLLFVQWRDVKEGYPTSANAYDRLLQIATTNLIMTHTHTFAQRQKPWVKSDRQNTDPWMWWHIRDNIHCIWHLNSAKPKDLHSENSSPMHRKLEKC